MKPLPTTPADRLDVNDRLGLLSLIDEGLKLGSDDSPVAADLFGNLWELVSRTAGGARVDHLKPDEAGNGFQVLEISAATGEILGRLNMLYLNKPMPCYYLVYVEVAPPYRKQGLGHQVLEHFGRFLAEKSSLGLLDNIIPEDDPTYTIYLKHGWRPIDEIIGEHAAGELDGEYMVYLPPRLDGKDLRRPVLKLVHHLRRRRAAIEMRDNELMVRQTIAEFKDLLSALMIYFEPQLAAGETGPLMRFMFTRYVTKLIAFRRRIGELIGYTGGESLDQLGLPEQVLALTMKSYAPRDMGGRADILFDEGGLMTGLPDEFHKSPVRYIEYLPNYRRPALSSWLKQMGLTAEDRLTIGHLWDLGFDPTRLKEVEIEGQPYIFERIQARQADELLAKREVLNRATGELAGAKVRGASLRSNPPLGAVVNKGNAYVLRAKVPGIHWDEAVDQLLSADGLKPMNAQLNLDRLIRSTAGAAYDAAADKLGLDRNGLRDRLAVFVSWDLSNNRPRITADFTSTFLETVWLA